MPQNFSGTEDPSPTYTPFSRMTKRLRLELELLLAGKQALKILQGLFGVGVGIKKNRMTPVVVN